MSFFILGKELEFPPSDCTDSDGIIAIGGDLDPNRLILAYKSGIFPWYSEGEPIIWHSPDPRFVLFPSNLRVSNSMRKTIRDGQFEITFDKMFEEVIRNCAHGKRRDQDGTWITEEMIQAYLKLHEMGIAHSVEVIYKDKLAGGLYGLIIGDVFFGESMFTKISNASKAAFITMVNKYNFSMIDCQVRTDHLRSLGAEHIGREDYLRLLSKGISEPDIKFNEYDC